MNTLLEALFILLILVGTTVDFIVRQLIPNEVVLVNSLCALIAVSTICVFIKITSLKNPLFIHMDRHEGKKITLSVSVNQPLTSIKSLININDPFLIIRFFAAFLVFVTHMMILMHPNQDLVIGIWRILKGGAHAGMAIFFTLSGFLMGKAFISGRYDLSRAGIFTFYQNRWIRIFPLMSFVIIFLLVFQYPHVIRFESLSIIRLLTFNYYGSSPLDVDGIGAMWSLSVEVQYYLIAPFVFSIFHPIIIKNKTTGVTFVIATIILLALINYFTNDTIFNRPNAITPSYFTLIGNLPFFLIGFVFNYRTLTLSEKSAKLITNGWFLLTNMVIFYIICNNHSDSIPTFIVISLITGYAITLLSAASKTDAFLTLKKFSIFKLFQILGALSYGFYLWHSGIGFVYAKLFPDGFSTHSAYLTEILIVGLIVLFISVISFVLVEDRFNSYKSITNKTSS